MSMLQGTVSLKRFLVLGPVPDEKDLQSGLEQDQFRPFQDGLEEERMGWCDWRNPLITPPDENWVSQERFAVFGLRIDTRGVLVNFEAPSFAGCPVDWQPVDVKVVADLPRQSSLDGLRVMWRREAGYVLTLALAGSSL